jgi:hypothetical protein
MNKEQMITVLRSVGVSESTITVMSNAFDLGFESAKDQAAEIALAYDFDSAQKIDDLTP